jgi:hypothetical protein
VLASVAAVLSLASALASFSTRKQTVAVVS